MSLSNTQNTKSLSQPDQTQTQSQVRITENINSVPQQLYEEFHNSVKGNKWLDAKKLIPDVLKTLQSEIGQTKPKSLTSAQQQAIKNAVRVGYYFDILKPEGDFKWLNDYVRQVYLDFKKSSDKADLHHFHRILDFVRFELRRDFSDFEHCYQIVNEVAEASEKEIAGSFTETEINSFRSRLNYIRFEIALKRQERYEAEKYLDLSEYFLTRHAQEQAKTDTDSEISQNILYLQTARVGLSKVFLKISSGRYEHAIQLQNLIEPTLKDKKFDPRAALRSVIAKSICQRSLYANVKKKLREDSTTIEKILKDKIYKENLPRLMLRLQYEYSLTLLLRIGLEPDQKSYLLKKIENSIKEINDNKIRDKKTDAAWSAQIDILTVRFKQHNEDGKDTEKIKEIEIIAHEAVVEADKTKFKLLRVEARIAEAVVLFRQEKYNEAIGLLNDAQDINKERGLISSDLTEFTQPELAALCFLYLARIYIRKNDKINAVNNFDNYQNLCSRVEHAWILERLAPEVEREVLIGVIGKVSQQTFDLTAQTHAARKRTIEQASEELQTHQIVPIAKHLGISPQTLYSWIRELQAAGITVNLYSNRNITLNQNIKQENSKLLMQKEEIERASRILGTSQKAKIAAYLEISRQTLYNRWNELEKSQLAPEID